MPYARGMAPLRVTSLFALALAAAAPFTAGSFGCGGCYDDFVVEDLRTTPASDCVMPSASAVDTCNGGYSVTVMNGCASDLVLDGQTITPNGSFMFPRGSGEGAAEDGRYALDGTLDGAAFRVSWILTDTSPE